LTLITGHTSTADLTTAPPAALTGTDAERTKRSRLKSAALRQDDTNPMITIIPVRMRRFSAGAPGGRGSGAGGKVSPSPAHRREWIRCRQSKSPACAPDVRATARAAPHIRGLVRNSRTLVRGPDELSPRTGARDAVFHRRTPGRAGAAGPGWMPLRVPASVALCRLGELGNFSGWIFAVLRAKQGGSVRSRWTVGGLAAQVSAKVNWR
jgi:hypothetical protein